MIKTLAFEIFILMCFIQGAQAAYVHGTIYAWQDFDEPLKNVIVQINSTPVQSMVATNGVYSFNLSKGTYLIEAKYYRNNLLAYSSEDVILIDRDGDFIKDLLLFPPIEPVYEFPENFSLPVSNKEEQSSNDAVNLILILMLFPIIFIFIKTRKSVNKIIRGFRTERKEKNKRQELPEDLRAIYDLILKKGGRINQRDLRKEVKLSESKISMMITDLEDRGLINKIKRGRSNLITAIKEGEFKDTPK